MNTQTTRWITSMLVLVAGVSLSADRVRLTSGKVIEGMFIGGDSKSVRLLLENGQVSEIPLGEAVAVEFTPRKPAPPPPAPTPAATPAPSPAPKPVTVPAGTTLNVRLTQSIDVDASQAGMTFKGLIDDPVMIDGSIVIPRGASAALQAVHVQQSGKMKGSDKITLKVNSIGFGGRVYEVTTSQVETKGKGEGKRTGPQGRRRRWSRCHRRRHRRRWRRRGDWSGGRGDHRRGGGQQR